MSEPIRRINDSDMEISEEDMTWPLFEAVQKLPRSYQMVRLFDDEKIVSQEAWESSRDAVRVAYAALSAIHRLGYPLNDDYPRIALDAYELLGYTLFPRESVPPDPS